MGTVVWLILAAYVLGSIPTGYVVGRLWGIDIRRQGSGNIGATNVIRTLGIKAGLPVALVDVAKSAVPVLVARAMGLGPAGMALTGVAAMVGHMFPFTLGFRGGKGVATGLGLMLILDPLATGILIMIFAATLAVTRYVSVGSVLAATLTPVLLWWRGFSGVVVGSLVVAAGLVLVRHRANIARLLTGTEARVGARRPPDDRRTASGE